MHFGKKYKKQTSRTKKTLKLRMYLSKKNAVIGVLGVLGKKFNASNDGERPKAVEKKKF